MKCWKHHAVFPHWRASLPPMLGNLTKVVLRCWGCDVHHPQSNRSLDTLPVRTSTQLLVPRCFPKATIVTPVTSRQRIHSISLPAAIQSPCGCPGRWLQSQPDTDFPWPCPWLLQEAPWTLHCAQGSQGWATVRTTYLSAFNVSTQVIYGLPFSMICHQLNDLQARVVSSPRGLHPAGQEQDGETLHWEVACSFSQGKGLECKEKGHHRALAYCSNKISRIQLFSSPQKRNTGIELWGKLGWKSFI